MEARLRRGCLNPAVAPRDDDGVHGVVADTEALLTPSTPTLVRMETLRRATLYASRHRQVAEQLAIPLTAGGGIRSLEDARAVVRAGADKVTANTAAVERPALIGELSREFGAQAVVLAIDAKRENQFWQVRVRGGRAATDWNAEDWARRGVEMGAGEILLTSVDRDGTQSGFDLALTAAISRAVSVPVIASGGAKLPQHFLDVFTQGAADAALAASIFHDQVQSIRALKTYLQANGVAVRLPC